MNDLGERLRLPGAHADFVEFLEREGAHHDLLGWVQRAQLDGARFASSCPRADWLLGVAQRAGLPQETARHALSAALLGLLVATAHEPSRALVEAVSAHVRTGDDGPAAEVLRRAVAETRTHAPSMTDTYLLEALERALDARQDTALVPDALAAIVEVAAVEVLECGSEAALREAHHRCVEAVRGVLQADTLTR